MVRNGVVLARVLPPRASSAAEARTMVREALQQAGVDEWEDAAQLAVSEVVTNALVHAGTDIHLQVRVDEAGLRVEVADGSPHLPAHRTYSPTSGTGRGLGILGQAADRWGTLPHGDGKVVWFEIRAASDPRSDDEPFSRAAAGHADVPDAVQVTLLNVPLLMHSAWQEHASAVLRELLLVRVEDDDLSIFELHAQASDAMNLLYEQVPAPPLGDDPDALMSSATEPGVSRGSLALTVPQASVPHFRTLDAMLSEAVQLADTADLLVPPTQPEIRDMSSWLCRQVLEQGTTGAAPVPWSSLVDSEPPADRPGDDDRGLERISSSSRALLATDEASVIVAVSRSVLDFLGYAEESELVGRRIITIVPLRYHQAHIAGTTLHMTNGRSPLLSRRVTVPVVCRGGEERMVPLVVEPHLLPRGRRLFTAEFFLDERPAPVPHTES